mmetsp:Transcript_16850/g.23420  ORF Transcript_16850/g.23420 Transcript_16850/m.23420 type:complete len:240 (+) Transcript_16850:123-842(+)
MRSYHRTLFITIAVSFPLTNSLSSMSLAKRRPIRQKQIRCRTDDGDVNPRVSVSRSGDNNQNNCTTTARRRTFFREAMTKTFTMSLGSILWGIPSASSAQSSIFPVMITYKEAIDILTSQRLACDDIVTVIQRGDLGEAAFKVQQLNSQVSVAGKVVLERLQSQSQNNNLDDSSISLVRLLKCQESFALLEESMSGCSVQLTKALKGKLGTAAPAQMKLLVTMRNVMSAYDDFVALLTL